MPTAAEDRDGGIGDRDEGDERERDLTGVVVDGVGADPVAGLGAGEHVRDGGGGVAVGVPGAYAAEEAARAEILLEGEGRSRCVGPEEEREPAHLPGGAGGAAQQAAVAEDPDADAALAQMQIDQVRATPLGSSRLRDGRAVDVVLDDQLRVTRQCERRDKGAEVEGRADARDLLERRRRLRDAACASAIVAVCGRDDRRHGEAGVSQGPEAPVRGGVATDEHKELVELRRRNRVLEMEIEILERASAYFARENVLPK